MPIELKMPALSPTMEEGTLAKWLVKVGDTVKSGDIMAEIETDKATMEFEAVDEGTISEIRVAEGTDGVKVGTVIAMIAAEGEEPTAIPAAPATPSPAPPHETASAERGYGASPADDAPVAEAEAAAKGVSTSSGDGAKEAANTGTAPSIARVSTSPPVASNDGERIKVSPLARRLAEAQNVDLATLKGSGPNGRIVKADVEGMAPAAVAMAPEARVSATATPATAPAAAPAVAAPFVTDIPHETVKLSNIRKTIARRLTESKQTIPHIYLTVDIRLDALLKLRGELNAALAPRNIKLSVNDMLIKALAASLIEVPSCNVSYTPTDLIRYSRADISVAVSTPTGLITPIIVGADTKAMSAISTEMTALAAKAREGKLQPHEYQGGTASISNMGMFGIKAFDAVINPPQAMIMAIGAGEKRPYVVDDTLAVATVMSATGSFDHRAIDGSDGAALMKAFKALCESPLGLVV